MSKSLQELYRGEEGHAPRARAGCPARHLRGRRARRDAPRAQLPDDDPALANAFGADGFHPLGLACFFGHVDSARVLLEHGAEVDALSRNEHIQTAAIHAAAASGETGVDDATRQGQSR